MSEGKIITIITTLYNKAKYLETWALSLAQQTYLSKMNILVVEDASTDDSLELLIKLTKKYNLPVKLIRNEKNMGLLYTVRRAYRELQREDVKTKYFAVLDADDYYLSPKKVEKAVKFLEAHDDYAAYASNLIAKYSSGVEKQLIAANGDITFSNMKGAPFFQTTAVTFRNFFTSELLDKMDYFTEEKKFGICEGDAFRYAISFGFGKLYFENSPDSVWLCDIGDWGTLSEFEQNLCNMRGHWELFEVYKAQFGTNFLTDANMNYMLCLTVDFYQKSLIGFNSLMQNLSFFEFQFKPYFIKNFNEYGRTGEEEVVNALLYHGKLLNDLGLSLNG